MPCSALKSLYAAPGAPVLARPVKCAEYERVGQRMAQQRCFQGASSRYQMLAGIWLSGSLKLSVQSIVVSY